MNTDMGSVLEFLLYVGQAKRIFRTGRVIHGADKVESVAAHMYRMALMPFLLPTISEESKIRCMKLALVHDLSESVVGNLTEFDGIPQSEKRPDVGREIFSLFNEYADQKTTEAKLVKDLDLFDMLVQEYGYEKLQSKEEFLDSFLSSSKHNIKTAIVQQWLDQLMECRSSGKQFQLPSDSNLNTLLKHILYDEQGTFLYKFPSSELHSKSHGLIANKNKLDR
ncbi:unnamed protein product [Rotaria socialis]|uniref:5'-deoxynucleotidase HDDC2 n=1 Tax=Rotaria socialis TaxID=392032 RepID=A0A821RDV5_9BILA|nr:unnamed protein product [Rotaria socialis]CAF4524693.1 unnamed protein product [Rotaria socialis]CAF4840943.1 unnamed protein product [Rotaria socialis]